MKRVLRILPAAIIACTASLAGAQTPASELDALRREVEQLKQEMRELKAQQQPAPVAAATPAPAATTGATAVTPGEIPGSIKLPDSETSLRFYGFAELHMLHDYATTSPGDEFSFLAFQPLRGTPAGRVKGNTSTTARTSRLGVKTTTPTEFGPMQITIEGGFYIDRPDTYPGATRFDQASLNSQLFRLRHAYGQWNGWLIGQTWSTFMDVDDTAETVDFNGPIGAPFLRQPMLRYSYATQNRGEFVVAVEAAKSVVVQGTGADAVPVDGNTERTPDLVLRWNGANDWGTLNARAVRHEFLVNDGVSGKHSARGYGFGAGGSIKIPNGDLLVAQVTGGDGIGRYIYYVDGATLDTATNQVLRERVWGATLGYTHNWSAQWRSSLALGYQKTQRNDYVDYQLAAGNDPNHTLKQVHVNLFWTPIKNIDFGGEYIWGRRETYNDGVGDLSRLDFLARYSF